MGQRALYTLYENGEASYFYSHWGANALTPLYRLSQAMEWQTENNKSIAHILEHLGDDGEYKFPLDSNSYMVFEKLDVLEANKMLSDYFSGSDLEMHITLDLDCNECLLDYNRNCPWFAAMDNYSIPIDVGLKNVELLAEYATKHGIEKFGEIEELYNQGTGIAEALENSRAVQKLNEYANSPEAREERLRMSEMMNLEMEV